MSRVFLLPERQRPMKPLHRRPSWIRLSAPGPKTRQKWLHEPSGWRIEHCGHPTAIWPYLVFAPDGQLHTASNGRCHRTLLDAAAFVELRHLEARVAALGRVVVGHVAPDGTVVELARERAAGRP